MEMPEDADKKNNGFLYKCSTFVENVLRKSFFRVGYMVAGRPLVFMLASLLFTGATLAGMIRFRSEARAQNLWVPQNTVALDNFDYVRERYGEDARFVNILCLGKEENGNIATKAAMLECLKIVKTGFNVKGAKLDGFSKNFTFADTCIKVPDQKGRIMCNTASPFGLFYDPDDVVLLENQVLDVDFFASVRKSIEKKTNEEIKDILENGPFTSPFGPAEIDPVDIMNAEGKGSDFKVLATLYTQFMVQNSTVINGEEVDEVNESIEEQLSIELMDDKEKFGTSEIDWELRSSWSDEDALAGALSGDLPLLSVGFVLLTVYVMLFLGDFHVVRSRNLCALAGLAAAGLSLGVTFGLSSAFGMFFGPVHQILPLLIFGIGVDDVFVVTRALDDVNSNEKFAEKTPRTRVALALSNAGSAITVTTVTNTIVFLLGAISSLPALRFFALWAAIGVFFDWFFTIFFYTPALALDTRRQTGKRRDCCFCLKVSPERDTRNEKNWFRRSPGAFTRFFKNIYGPFITNKAVSGVIIVVFLGFFATCVWGCTQLYLKFDFSFFYPDGSDQLRYQNRYTENFEIGFPAPIYLAETDISTAENQRKYLELCHEETGKIVTSEYIQDGSVDCWYQNFQKVQGVSGNAVINPATFYVELNKFLNSPAGSRYKRDFAFKKDGTFDSVRFNARKVYTANNSAEIETLLGIREAADSVGFGEDSNGNPKAFTSFFQDLFTEQYKALPREIGLSLGLASIAVAVVCLQLVGHPLLAVICVLVVGIVIIDILGVTFFSGINLNSVSVITIVIATGIAVDYVVHVARSFLEQVGTRKERSIKALGALGPPVFYAGISTFLAISILAFASSYIFRVIFLGFLSLIIIGLAHGLILGPVILSLIGPPSFYDTEEEKEAAEFELISAVEEETAA